jgi:hypothetical protein
VRIRRWLEALGVVVLFWSNGAGAEESSQIVWSVTDPPATGFVAADRSGFWTAEGKHHTPDGKLDLSVQLPAGVDSILFAATGPRGPVVVGTPAGKGGSPKVGAVALVIAAFDPQGKDLWRVEMSSTTTASSIPVVDGMGVTRSADVVVAGQFSGCIRFGGKGKATCVDEKPARQAQMCEGEHCTTPFVAVYDAKGKLKSVFAPPGYPSQHFVAAPDGRIALAGVFMGKLDLDPAAERSALIAEPVGPKGHNGQAFWSIFGPADRPWLSGYGLLGAVSSSAPTAVFDGDGALLVLLAVHATGRGKISYSLANGTDVVTVPPVHGESALLAVEKVASRPTLSVLASDMRLPAASAADLKLLVSPGGGIFAYGALPPPPGSVVLEAPARGQQEVLIAGLRGGWSGFGIRVPEATFIPQAVLADKHRVCFAFNVVGAHTLRSGGSTIAFGEPHAGTAAIGCFGATRQPGKGDR